MTPYAPPAYATLRKDPALTMLELSVYERLLDQLDFANHPARRVKVGLLAWQLQRDKGRVGEAVQALIDRGYLHDHGRAERNIRMLALVWSIAPAEDPCQLSHFVTHSAA
jgi:hypothetical protein